MDKLNAVEAGAATPEQSYLQDKLIADLRARLALHGGHILLVNEDGTYTVTRWSLHKHCRDLAEVERFLKIVGGA